MEELHKGMEVIIDYEASNDTNLIDWFEEQSMFEGFARIQGFDDSYALLEGCPYAVQLEYVIILGEGEDWDYAKKA